jgi:hypothetical protein
MQEVRGIVDEARNPFISKYWIDQNYQFTRMRSEDVEKLFGLTVNQIKAEGKNKGSYPAFVSIRWGFAKIENGKLAATAQWKDREQYFQK